MADLYACLDVRHGLKPELHRRTSVAERGGKRVPGNPNQRKNYKISREEFAEFYLSWESSPGAPAKPTTWEARGRLGLAGVGFAVPTTRWGSVTVIMMR